MSDSEVIGFVGLGEMGGRMARRLADAGCALAVYDAAGTAARAPAGARVCESTAAVAAAADLVLLSLPDGPAVRAVVGEIAAAAGRRTRCLADHSTIGPEAAGAVARALADAGIAYLDAPVSGGTRGAAEGTLAMMVSGDAGRFEAHRETLGVMARNLFHVGAEPGQGQAMKLLNNVLSAASMTATTEAVAFGEAQGLDLETMIAVLNVSTGRNTATSDKFPTRVATGTFDAGFTIDLLSKDVDLFLAAVQDAGQRAPVGGTVGETLRAMKRAMPGADFTPLHVPQGGRRRRRIDGGRSLAWRAIRGGNSGPRENVQISNC